MTVMFQSDGSNEYGGMKAAIIFANSVASGCGGKIDLLQSKTFSTQRGALYEPLEDCHWTVTAKPGKNVRFTINRIDLKNSTNSTHADGRCSGDFLEVRDGGPFAEIIGQYCGNVVPHPVTSSLNVLWIRLFTDSTIKGEGVSATLDPIDSPCGESIYEIGNNTEIVKSPGYPGDFPAGIQCRWIFKNVDKYSTLRLHLETLDMEDTVNCDGDYLQISDEGRYHRTSSYKYCGQASAVDYHSDSNEIHVSLRSTADHLPKPRKFTFDIAQTSCNRNYTAEQGRIVHQRVGECWTTITAPTNRTISLYFKQFRFYDHGNCSTNFVQVHDGDFKSPVLHTLCGSTEPSPIFTTGNVLSFHAKSSTVNFGAKNYDILYTTTDKGRGCGGKLFNYGGIFTSPMYPNNRRNGGTCEWEISVPRGYQVALVFDFFDLGTSDICPTDYLVVRELNKDDGREETYCPGQIPAPFRATTNIVRVTYVSSLNNGGTGWVIRFMALQGTEPIEHPDQLWQPIRRIPYRIG